MALIRNRRSGDCAVRAALTSIRTKELDRLYNRLPELDERSRQEIGQFADRLVATILRPPLESLRDGEPRQFLSSTSGRTSAAVSASGLDRVGI